MNKVSDYPIQTREIIKVSTFLYEKNLVSAAGGNVSERTEGGILITGSNVSLREVHPNDLVLCSLQNEIIDARPKLRPSKETKFHLGIYKTRPSIKCIIHAHPCYSVLCSLIYKELPLYTQSAKLKLIHVPVIPKGKPGSMELAEKVIATIKKQPDEITAFLMEGHGIIAIGNTMEEALNQAELLEDSCKIAVYQKLLSKE